MTAVPLVKLPDASYTAIGSEVLRGLAAQPKTLSPWLFYDAEGSRLFEAITTLPEYYLTRTEREILARNAPEIVTAAAEERRLSIYELGAGTATKTGLLLKAALQIQPRITYRALDVSEAALAEAKLRLEAELPGVTVEPRVCDYTSELRDIGRARVSEMARRGSGQGDRRLVLYIGSSIGNFVPGEALALLRSLRARLDPGDGLLLGIDMVKDAQTMLAAYNDSAGITGEFNKNVLVRMNRELDAGFDLKLFRHQAVWNERESRMEMHLESTVAQRISIPALNFETSFEAGETIHTENCYKFTDRRVRELLKQSGFSPSQCWSDTQGWFGVYLAKAG